MKKRFTPTRIAFALWQAASGTPVSEIIRKIGMTDVTSYHWKVLQTRTGTTGEGSQSRWKIHGDLPGVGKPFA